MQSEMTSEVESAMHRLKKEAGLTGFSALLMRELAAPLTAVWPQTHCRQN